MADSSLIAARDVSMRCACAFKEGFEDLHHLEFLVFELTTTIRQRLDLGRHRRLVAIRRSPAGTGKDFLDALDARRGLGDLAFELVLPTEMTVTFDPELQLLRRRAWQGPVPAHAGEPARAAGHADDVAGSAL